MPYDLSHSQQRNVIENGFSITIYFWRKLNKQYICNYAADCGRLDVLKYAIENKCSYDKITCSLAARSGKLECVKYLRENGCSWAQGTCYYAVLKHQFGGSDVPNFSP